MNTLKSAALLVVLLGVLYGVYVAINKPEVAAPTSGPSEEIAPPLVEWGSSTSSSSTGAPSLTPGDAEENPATPGSLSVRGGAYPSNLDASASPPATTPTIAPPDPTAGGSRLERSSYESPVTSRPTAESSASHATTTAVTNGEAAAASASLTAYALRRDLQEVEQLVNAGKFKAALTKLSPHFRDADLAPEQRTLLYSWLDALAGKVIYSREHLLAPAHQIRKGETLFNIADQYNVSHRLLQSINNREVSDPMVLVAGTELKVVPGPFRAEANLSASEITILVNDLYAGRFTFTLGDQPPAPGDYKVVDKQSQQRSYYALDGRVIPANDPNNPYGGWWLSLGGEVCIHGSPAFPGDKTLGCISLSPQDAKDLYGILAIGSEVRVR